MNAGSMLVRETTDSKEFKTKSVPFLAKGLSAWPTRAFTRGG